MAKFAQLLAALALVAVAGLFTVQYLEQNKPPIPPPAPTPLLGPMQPHFAEALATSLAERLSQQVGQYRADHSKLPRAADFWKDMSAYIDKPLHNPINGSDEVVGMRMDLDATDVGWVYDEQTGAVYPGAVFNAAGAPATRP